MPNKIQKNQDRTQPKKKPDNPAGKGKKSGRKEKAALFPFLLMLSYALIPVITPNFNTFDSNGTKFLAIGLLNLVSLPVILSGKAYRNDASLRSGFFMSFTGILYAAFIAMEAISLVRAINIPEAILNLSKFLTVFVSAYTLSVLFRRNRDYAGMLAVALAFLLVADSLTVFFNMWLFVTRQLASIMDIKSVYSHKNILTSALFLKIPFALYLMFYSGGWKRQLGYFSALSAVLATLMLSTRAFYLGLVILLIALLVFAVTRQIVRKRQGAVMKVLPWAGLVVLAVIIYSLAQHFLFPKNTDTDWNTNIVSRLSTIRSDESSTHARLSSWKRSLRLIRENPLGGVGTGNWKVAVLKYENLHSPDFTYTFKNHNDYLEITAETGIIGGLLFLSVLLSVLAGLARKTLDPEEGDEGVKLMFIPGFGILAYMVDAFFNFPADRPEVQSFFAVFIAMATVFSGLEIRNRQGLQGPIPAALTGKTSGRIIRVALPLLLILLVVILSMNVRSLFYQRRAFEDRYARAFTHPASYFISGFPSIPAISYSGEPVQVTKALYLLNENRTRDAITLLESENPSPYDSRREYHLARAWSMEGNTDSAIYWGRKAIVLKPLNSDLVLKLSSWLYTKGRQQEAEKILSSYLNEIRDNPEVWKLAAGQYWNSGQKEKARITLDSAVKNIPGDTTLIHQRRSMLLLIRLGPYEDQYRNAQALMDSKKYQEALPVLSSIIKNRPRLYLLYKDRAMCWYMTFHDRECIADIDKVLAVGQKDFALLNLRGASLVRLGKREEACRDFREAMEHGNQSAAGNFRKYCIGK